MGVEEEMSYIQLDLDKITSRVQDAEGNISTLEQTATSLRSDIDGKIDGEDAQSLIDQSLEGVTLSASNGATSSTIKLLYDGAEIDSAKIEFTGVVTFNALSGSPGTGQTTINGGWLKGETIEGATIKGGTFKNLTEDTWFGLGEDSGAWGFVLSNIAHEVPIFGVYNGDFGYTSFAGKLGFTFLTTDAENEIVMPFGNWDFSYADSVDFGGVSADDLGITFDLSDISLSSIGAETAYLSVEKVGRYKSYHVVSNRAIVPEDGSEYPYVGTTEFPWDTMYADSCTCCTSDENRKNSIEDLPDKYLTMFDNLHPKRFKMNNGTSGRFHPGYTAQDVKAAMDIAKVDSTEFGGWIKGTDKDGNDIYMLRYEEFGAIYAAKIKQLEARVAKLEGGVKS